MARPTWPNSKPTFRGYRNLPNRAVAYWELTSELNLVVLDFFRGNWTAALSSCKSLLRSMYRASLRIERESTATGDQTIFDWPVKAAVAIRSLR